MTGREDVSNWTLKKVNAQITHWKVDGYLNFCPFLKSLNRVLLHKKEGFFFLPRLCQYTIQWNKCMCFAVCLYCQEPNNGFSAGWGFQQISLTKTGPLQGQGNKVLWCPSLGEFCTQKLVHSCKLVYCLFVFISAISKPRAIKLMTKMEARKVIQSSFLFGPSTFQEKIRVRERFISLETSSECEWFLDACLLSLQAPGSVSP